MFPSSKKSLAILEVNISPRFVFLSFNIGKLKPPPLDENRITAPNILRDPESPETNAAAKHQEGQAAAGAQGEPPIQRDDGGRINQHGRRTSQIRSGGQEHGLELAGTLADTELPSNVPSTAQERPKTPDSSIEALKDRNEAGRADDRVQPHLEKSENSSDESLARYDNEEDDADEAMWWSDSVSSPDESEQAQGSEDLAPEPPQALGQPAPEGSQVLERPAPEALQVLEVPRSQALTTSSRPATQRTEAPPSISNEPDFVHRFDPLQQLLRQGQRERHVQLGSLDPILRDAPVRLSKRVNAESQRRAPQQPAPHGRRLSATKPLSLAAPQASPPAPGHATGVASAAPAPDFEKLAARSVAGQASITGSGKGPQTRRRAVVEQFTRLLQGSRLFRLGGPTNVYYVNRTQDLPALDEGERDARTLAVLESRMRVPKDVAVERAVYALVPTMVEGEQDAEDARFVAEAWVCSNPILGPLGRVVVG